MYLGWILAAQKFDELESDQSRDIRLWDEVFTTLNCLNLMLAAVW